VDHGLAQLFGAGLATAVAQCDFVRYAIVLNYDRVIDGNVSGPLIKVCYGIPAEL
jgi:hypothetical protein